MKLYEFTITDNLNLPESKILDNAKGILEDEARIQGWKPGYRFELCNKGERLTSGEIRYFFSVEGEFIDGMGHGSQSDEINTTLERGEAAARGPETSL